MKRLRINKKTWIWIPLNYSYFLTIKKVILWLIWILNNFLSLSFKFFLNSISKVMFFFLKKEMISLPIVFIYSWQILFTPRFQTNNFSLPASSFSDPVFSIRKCFRKKIAGPKKRLKLPASKLIYESLFIPTREFRYLKWEAFFGICLERCSI